MSTGEQPAPRSWSEYRAANPIYRLLFAVGLLVLAVSLLAGVGQSIRLLGAPPIAVDATVLGRVLFEQGDLAGGIGEFRLANVIDPAGYPSAPELEYPAPSHPNAAALVEQGRAAVRQRPRDASAHLRLGRALMWAGAYPESIASLQRALELDPALPQVQPSLGQALLLDGRLREAETSLREALKRDPDLPALHEDLAVALYRQARLKESAVAFERARELRARSEPGSGAVR